MGIVVGLIKWLFKLLIYFLIFAAIVVLLPNLPPYTKFSSIKLTPTQERVGPLAPNIALNNVQQMYKDKLLGPEAFQVYNGELYTGLATGEIVKVSPGGHVTFVTKIGQPCTGLTKEHICGRALGFEIDEKTGTLYVSDAYHGIWKVNLKTDKKQLLVSPRVAIDGIQPKIFNSLVLGKNGDFYWTDSSSEFALNDGAYSILTDPSGRFFHYNAAKNESKVLLDGLWFPNGVAISRDNQFVVISETSRNRLVKYYIDGPKKGKSEVFVDGLPGSPDNLRALPDGSGVLTALYLVFDENHPLLSRSLAEVPLARKFLARFHRLIEIPFEYLNNVYPHVIFEEIVYHIGHFKSVSALGTGMSGLLQIDWNGNIVASYYNTDGTVTHISDAVVFGDKLYLGNPHAQDFIGSVQPPPLLHKAFSNKKIDAAPKATPNVVKHEPEKPKEVKPVASQAPKPKPTEAPKPPKPTEAPKQKPQEPPKATTQAPPKQKPQEPIKPKVQEAPKQTPQEAPKPKPQEAPKQKSQEQTKQNQQQPPKQMPKEPPKQEDPKPVTEKPVEKKTETPKATTQPPKTTPPPKEKPVTTTEPKVATPKATNPPPKQAEAKTTTPKPVTKPAVNEKPSQTTTGKPQKMESKPVKENGSESKPVKADIKAEPVPIKEEIPSDTPKPMKEKLKVIKKGGPTEIPVLNNI